MTEVSAPETTTTSTDTTNGETDKRHFDVAYEIKIFDTLPDPLPRGGGGGGKSENEDALKAIKENAEYHKSWVMIANYGKPTACTAAKNVLQQRHGKTASVEGFQFANRPIDSGTRRGLFVHYDPSAVVPGAKEQHEQKEKERLTKLAARKVERDKAKEATVAQPTKEEVAAADRAKTQEIADRVKKEAAERKAAGQKQ